MEALLRLAVFIGILMVMVLWEARAPLRHLSQQRRKRWPVNFGLALLNAGLLRLSIGAAAWQTALWAANHEIGILNHWTMPIWFNILLSLLLLDLAIYAQHIAAHRWTWFWRLHQVHHSDMDFDASTAIRFHPLEIMLSMVYKIVLVVLLGAAPLAVIGFEIILNGCALFNHGNISLPASVERMLRFWLVTPDMHRIHHSTRQAETDSNYGFSLSCWDRLFKTYCHQAQLPQTEMPIGLTSFRTTRELGLSALLLMPFRTLRQR